MEDSDNPRILVIDDDETVRKTIVRMLGKSGYRVISASNGQEGLELFSTERPDLVITDLRMPGMDGLEVLERMSETTAAIPVIVVSGQGTITDAVEALRRGAVDYLIKPIEEIAILTHSVVNALERARLIEENRRYRENLEEEVKERTCQLETTNESLLREISSRKQAVEELEHSRQQLRELAAHIESAREDERTNIAREIHDELGQVLTALKMDASWLKNKLPLKDDRLLEKISTMINLIDSSIETVQKITSELRPGLLDDLGLTEAIEWMAEDFSDRTGIKCTLNIELNEDKVSKDQATAIFRIFQETINNAARHSEASEVSVSLQTNAKGIAMEIRDNGGGITEKQKFHPKSFGLIGMQERSRHLGGSVEFSGAEGKGTKVTLNLPY